MGNLDLILASTVIITVRNKHILAVELPSSSENVTATTSISLRPYMKTRKVAVCE